jgi:magnesium transporter
MITTFRHKNLTWVDIEGPTTEDISTVIRDFGIHPSWANELLVPSERSKTDVISEVFYAVLHYPDHPSHQHESRDIEVDYIVGDNFLITAHYAPIDTFLELSKQFEIESTLGRSKVSSGGQLFLGLNNHLYMGLREELEPLRKISRKIEGEIFNGHEYKMVHEISHLGGKLLDFRQALRSHKTILRSLQVQAPRLFPNTPIEEDHIFREYLRVENALENIRELLRELRETNDSLLTAKNNEVTKKLTLMAFITFPLTLVATVLVAHNAPMVFQGIHGFWLTVSILVILFILMQAYFLFKKWI